MSILLSGRVKVALSVLGSMLVVLLAPSFSGAATCGVMSNSFQCMTGVKKTKKSLAQKAGIKKSKRKSGYKVAAVRPTARVSDAAIVQPRRKPAKKARRKVRKVKKLKSSKRYSRSKRSIRRKKRASRKKGKLRTIGRRLNARSVRKLTKRSSRSKKVSRKSTRKSTRKSSRKTGSKRGWRTRSKGLGYVAANRGVSTSCFPARLKKLLRKVSAHYGRKLIITSGYRSHRHNRRIGGARRSQHLHCTAADFRIPGVNKYALARYLKSLPGRGGVGTYSGNGIVHLDIGPRRTWHWGGRKRRHAGKRRSKRYSSRRRSVRSKSHRKRRHSRRTVRFRGSRS